MRQDANSNESKHNKLRRQHDRQGDENDALSSNFADNTDTQSRARSIAPLGDCLQRKQSKVILWVFSSDRPSQSLAAALPAVNLNQLGQGNIATGGQNRAVKTSHAARMGGSFALSSMVCVHRVSAYQGLKSSPKTPKRTLCAVSMKNGWILRTKMQTPNW